MVSLRPFVRCGENRLISSFSSEKWIEGTLLWQIGRGSCVLGCSRRQNSPFARSYEKAFQLMTKHVEFTGLLPESGFSLSCPTVQQSTPLWQNSHHAFIYVFAAWKIEIWSWNIPKALFGQSGDLVCSAMLWLDAGSWAVKSQQHCLATPHTMPFSSCCMPCLPWSLQKTKKDLLPWQRSSIDLQCVLTCGAFNQQWSASNRLLCFVKLPLLFRRETFLREMPFSPPSCQNLEGPDTIVWLIWAHLAAALLDFASSRPERLKNMAQCWQKSLLKTRKLL